MQFTEENWNLDQFNSIYWKTKNKIFIKSKTRIHDVGLFCIQNKNTTHALFDHVNPN